MLASMIKMTYHVSVIMSVLITFYYIENYNKLLTEIKYIKSKVKKL